MPTQCSRDLFGYEVVEGRQVVAAFDGGDNTSDAGALLLGATDRAIGLVGRFAACFADGRAQAQVEHTVEAMVAQRVFGIALGYEDVVDHDQLRFDPVLATLAGKLTARRKNCAPLAGKSTLNRLEHAPSEPARYHKIGHDGAAIERLFVDLLLEAHKTPPGEIILDLDATDDPLHGHQEGRFFHGYYDCYCYLPLYVFCGRHLLAAKLRRSNIDASAGATAEVARIVGQIRARWPRVKILLRANSGFARDELMTWCEANGVDYVFGLARNERLVGAIAHDLAAVALESLAQGGPVRRCADFACLAAGTGLGPRSPTRRPSARQLEPHATRDRQGRAPAQGRQSTLRGHLAAGHRHGRAHPVRGYLLRPRRHREPDVWTPPALQAGFFFVQACLNGCCYVSGLAGRTPSGLDEIRELTPDYQDELGALRFSRALPTPVRPACHRVEDHPRSPWKSVAGSRITTASIKPPRDRLRRG